MLLVMKNIYQYIIEQHEDLDLIALATVTRTSDSAPQKPGSSALFGKNGLITGTVGGGLVEGNIQKSAIEALKSKTSGHFSFNLANDISKKEEAICGGQISVLIDANVKNSLKTFEQVKLSLSIRKPGVIITMATTQSGKMVIINRYFMSDSVNPGLPPAFMEKIGPVVRDIISSGNPSDFRELELSIPNEETSSIFFFEPVLPPCSLVIAGAGHIGKALSHLGSLLGFEVTVIDDRPEFANTENLPDADHVVVKNIGEAVHKIEKDVNTFIVIVTRGHKDDAEALKACIGSGVAYTGMIGSRNKISAMRKDFIEKKWASPELWDKVCAPIGLDIKSQTVEEIAVSIAAQLVLVKNSRK